MKTRNIVTLFVCLITLGVARTYSESLDHYYYEGFQWAFSTDDTTRATVQGSTEKTIIYNNIPSEIIYRGQKYPTTKIVSKAFYQVNTTHVKNFIIPESVVDLGENLFHYWNVIDTITISCPNMNGLTTENAIGAKVLLLDVKFYPSGYDHYYKYNRTFGAEEIITGSRVNRIPGWFAFNGMRETNIALHTLFLSDSIRDIGQMAFYNCTTLKSVTFGKNINSIGAYAFTGCERLDTVVWNIKKYPDITRTSVDPFCWSTTSTITGGDLRPNIKSFTLGTEVEYVPRYLCASMGIESISIPYSVTAIGDVAFYNCKSLRSIYNYSSVPLAIDSSVFDGVNKTQCTLYVPQESVAAYQAADVWKDFTIVGSLTNFSPLLNNIAIASAYLETISLQEEYSEIADVLRDAINNAQNVAQQLTSTVEQVSQASQNLEAALQSAKESIHIINTTLFEKRKNMAINYCDSIIDTEESPTCIQLINDALSTIRELSYNEEITLTENLTLIENLIKILNDNIAQQHEQEQLALDKEKFAEYKEMAKDSCLSLLTDQDSEIVLQLITEAILEIDSLQYDEELTYSQNQAKIDDIISQLINDIDAQRKKEDIPNANQLETIHKVVYNGHMYILKGGKIYSLHGQQVK